MKNKKGFTLVELLAVIVVLAIILVIAVPMILKTIEDSRRGSFLSSAEMVASAAETYYLQELIKGKEAQQIELADIAACRNVAKLSADFDKCVVRFNAEGKAVVTLEGTNGKKFEKYGVCNATLEQMTEPSFNKVLKSGTCTPKTTSDKSTSGFTTGDSSYVQTAE